MGTKKKAVKKAAKKVATDVAAPKNLGGSAAKNATIAHVDDGSGRIRTYSKELHGDSFLELAKEFASKEGGRKVVPE